MATFDYTNGSIDGQMVPRKTACEENEVFIRRNIVDFSKKNLSTSDNGKVLDIEEGIIVKAVYARVITADSGGGTFDIGASTSGNEFADNVSPANEGDVLGGAATHPVYFDSAGGIYVTGVELASLTTAKLEILAECIKGIDVI